MKEWKQLDYHKYFMLKYILCWRPNLSSRSLNTHILLETELAAYIWSVEGREVKVPGLVVQLLEHVRHEFSRPGIADEGNPQRQSCGDVPRDSAETSWGEVVFPHFAGNPGIFSRYLERYFTVKTCLMGTTPFFIYIGKNNQLFFAEKVSSGMREMCLEILGGYDY